MNHLYSMSKNAKSYAASTSISWEEVEKLSITGDIKIKTCSLFSFQDAKERKNKLLLFI